MIWQTQRSRNLDTYLDLDKVEKLGCAASLEQVLYIVHRPSVDLLIYLLDEHSLQGHAKSIDCEQHQGSYESQGERDHRGEVADEQADSAATTGSWEAADRDQTGEKAADEQYPAGNGEVLSLDVLVDLIHFWVDTEPKTHAHVGKSKGQNEEVEEEEETPEGRHPFAGLTEFA